MAISDATNIPQRAHSLPPAQRKTRQHCEPAKTAYSSRCSSSPSGFPHTPTHTFTKSNMRADAPSIFSHPVTRFLPPGQKLRKTHSTATVRTHSIHGFSKRCPCTLPYAFQSFTAYPWLRGRHCYIPSGHGNLVLGSCHVPFGTEYSGEWLLEFRICVCVTDDGEFMWRALSWTSSAECSFGHTESAI